MTITTIVTFKTIKTKTLRFADIPLENFACPPEIIAASRYVEANIGDNDGGDDWNVGDGVDGGDDGNKICGGDDDKEICGGDDGGDCDLDEDCVGGSGNGAL